MIISVVGATAVASILFWAFFLQGHGGAWLRLYILAGLVLLVVGSIIATWREARFLRVPPQIEITRACDFSDNVGSLFVGQRRIYAIRNAAFAEAFAAANRKWLWTDAVRKRDTRLSTVVVVVLIAVALFL